MVLDQSPGGWTATEVNPAVTSDVSLTEGASQAPLAPVPSRPFSLAVQALIVLAVALATGLLVFFAVRAAVTSDTPSDEQAQDLSELPTVGLEADGAESTIGDDVDSSRSGWKRDTLDDGLPADADQNAAPVIGSATVDSSSGDAEPPAAMAATADDQEDQANPEEAADADGGNAETDPDTGDGEDGDGSSTGPTTTLPDQPAPTTPAPPTTSATTAATTVPTTQPPTTPRPTTPTTAPTTVVTTTTIPTTTTSLPTISTAAAPVISSPADGSVHTWEAGVEFVARTVDDAVRYCWTVESVDSNGRTETCGDQPGYTLPGGTAGVPPGPAVATITAFGQNGDALDSESVTIILLARDLVSAPTDGEERNPSNRLRIEFNSIPTVTNYCVALIQGDTTQNLCDDDPRIVVFPWRLEEGPLTIVAEVRNGGEVIGKQTIEMTLVD